MKLINILDTTLGSILLINSKGCIHFANQAAHQLFAYAEGELIGQHIEQLIPATAHAVHAQHFKNYLQKPEKRIMNHGKRFKAVRKDQTDFSISISLNPCHIEGELYINLLVQDMSELEAVKLKQENAQRLEAIGEMVAGIAHNFNNLLACIKGQAYLLGHSPNLEAPEHKRIQSIDQLCDQSAQIVKDLMNYARSREEKQYDFNISDALLETISLMQASLPARIKLKHQICPHLMIHGSRAQLQQVFINIINNASDAIADANGSIQIIAKSCASENCTDQDRCSQYKRKHQLVCISIRDSGMGIAAENLEKIFKTFYTSKPTGKGTGLGLSTSRSIIHQHGGIISANSEVHKGTVFQIFLPLAHNTDNNEAAIDLCARQAVKTKTILLIDDDATILRTLKHVLESFGHTVIACEKSKKALKVFAKDYQRIELIISDISMPKMSGTCLIQSMKKIKADIPFLFITGYDVDSELDRELKSMDASLFMKPLDYKHLKTAIDHIE